MRKSKITKFLRLNNPAVVFGITPYLNSKHYFHWNIDRKFFKITSTHFLHVDGSNFWIASTSGDIMSGTLITRPLALDIAIFAITKAYNIPYSHFLCWLEDFSLFSRQKGIYIYIPKRLKWKCVLYSVLCVVIQFSHCPLSLGNGQ